MEALTKAELIRLVKSLQERLRTLKGQEVHLRTHAPKDFEGISGIRRQSASLDSFDTKILCDGQSVEREKTLKYKAATALLVNRLLSSRDAGGLDQVFDLLK